MSREPCWLMNAQARDEDDGAPPTPNYQTVRLSRGKHRSSEEGACVMELAAMLGGYFSDRVHCVDPAIGAFLWGYNDHVDDDLRQDLYRYAAAVLDSRRDDGLAARRAEMCRIWALQAQSVRRWCLPWPIRFRRRPELDALLFDCERAGINAARLARVDRAWHARTLSFIDMLVWLGSQGDESVTPASVVAPLRAREEEIALQRPSAPLVGAGRAAM